jgi:hypothetical protein
MAIHKRYHFLVCTFALTAILAFLWVSSRTKSDGVQELKKNGWGSAEEAFGTASRTIQDYLSTSEGAPVTIDPQFRATLHSRTKIWTVKGYAFCPTNDTQCYRWTVILDYDGVQDWEILVKIVTPVFAIPASGQIEGISHMRGELVQVDPGD